MPAPSDSCQGPVQTRPGTVSTTGFLLLGVALSSVPSLIAALSSYPAIKSVYETVFGGTAHGVVAPEDLAVFAVGISAAIVLTYGATALILASEAASRLGSSRGSSAVSCSAARAAARLAWVSMRVRSARAIATIFPLTRQR
ncbi:hypothetical protein GCM10009661_08340 [Catellatospora chokoriensis]|uniref:Uncharacterized protein n=1 Tax=Catellatospora chokoriensis TaxID=310353 RepID=A0A8J3K1Q1_9ACTN|nr:hypothetical protein Cch02nite_25440 [Catellatospora chokoriensis]